MNFELPKPITVAELIEHLKGFDQSLPVAYRCHSEQVLLEPGDIEVKNLVIHRPDGWIQNWRKDMPTQNYLVFPGN